MTPVSEHLQGILKTLPTKPGCYIMKNADGTIIYVGKAINLRNGCARISTIPPTIP